MSPREQLVLFLEERLGNSGRAHAAGLPPDASLIKSGLLDSSNLLQLAVWIERELGVALNLMDTDMANEWDTVDDILRYIETRRGRRVS